MHLPHQPGYPLFQNKAPYKTNFAAFFNEGGKKSRFGRLLHSHRTGSLFPGRGIYMPEAPVLAAIRQEIDYNLADWEKIIPKPGVQKIFSKGLDQELVLSRPPKDMTRIIRPLLILN